MRFDYHVPTRVLFGQGALEELGKISLPGRKALLCITSGGSLKRYGYLDRVLSLLKQNGVETVIFDGVQPNPNTDGVMKAVALGKKEQVDFVIGFGGGSSIDTAKAAAAVIRNGGDIWEYMGGITGKLKPTRLGALPIVAISTTSGTGSEVNPCAVITKEATHEKIDLSSEDIFPAITVIDPCIQTTLPPMLTACQGMDALFHSAEGFIANCATPIGDLYALKSIALVAENLPTAVRNGNDIKAREGMCLANLYAGMVESCSDCTSEHAIGHSLGAMHTGIPHGAALSLVCRECFRYYAQFVPERLAEMAAAVGYPAAAEGFLSFLDDLLSEVGLAEIDYTKWGVDPARAREYAQNSYDVTQALHDRDVHPMPLEDCVGIIRRSLSRT